MASKQFGLWLDENAAARIKNLVAPYKGTVGGYAAALVSEFSRLPTSDQEELRQLISARVKRLEMAGFLDYEKIPAVPTVLPSDTKTLLAAVSPQNLPAHKLHAHPTEPASKATELHALA